MQSPAEPVFSPEHPSEKPSVKPRVLAIANQKGGVGKTTTTVNLATALAAVGHQVLVFDLDPQGNASTAFGLQRRPGDVGAYHAVIERAPIATAIHGAGIPNLDIVPATLDLAGAELELVDLDQREYRLQSALGALDTTGKQYEFVLIDCPPALGLLTLNALVAADAVLVPLQCEFLALEGLSQLTRTIERVQKTFNKSLELQGIVLTMFDSRNNLSALVAEDVRSYFGDKVYHTVIPRNVRVSEAPSHGKPVLLYDIACAGSQAYIHLAGEVLRREGLVPA